MRIVTVQKLRLSRGKNLLGHRYSAPLRRTSCVVRPIRGCTRTHQSTAVGWDVGVAVQCGYDVWGPQNIFRCNWTPRHPRWLCNIPDVTWGGHIIEEDWLECIMTCTLIPHKCSHVCSNAYTCVHIYIYINIHAYKDMYTWMHSYVYIFIYIYIHTYIYIYIHIYTYIYIYQNICVYNNRTTSSDVCGSTCQGPRPCWAQHQQLGSARCRLEGLKNDSEQPWY